METRQSMTGQESLDLIASMIRNTQRNLEPGDGGPFIIWGMTSFITAAVVAIGFGLTGSYDWMWAWFFLPVLGFVWKSLANRKRKQTVTTYVDRVVGQVWLVLGICVGLIMLSSFLSIVQIPILMIIAMLVFAGQAITGGIIQLRYIKIAGIVGICLSMGLPFLPLLWQIMAFACLFLFCMVIPGWYMNGQAKRIIKNQR